MRNKIDFELSNDRLLAHALRVEDASDNCPTWNVAFHDADDSGEKLFDTFVSRDADGEGETTFHSSDIFVALENDPNDSRLLRVVHAAVYLGSTIAASPNHPVVASYHTEIEFPPIAYTILDNLGFRPGDEDMTIEGQPPLGVRTNAGSVRRALGPTLPVGFSLSPAETDY